MRTNKKIVHFLILSALTFLLAGCQALREPIDVVFKSEPPKQQQNTSWSQKRFQNTASQGLSPVDSAMKLVQKHAELMEKMTVLQQKNLELIAENSQLNERINALDPELERTKKNLDDAEDLLIDMITELNNWKVDILGYRDEMREASTAQMEILLKIAQAMGAEVIPEKEQEKQLTKISGESNE